LRGGDEELVRFDRIMLWDNQAIGLAVIPLFRRCFPAVISLFFPRLDVEI